MSESVSRREFLKLTGLGAAVTAVLTGCGPASRFVVRRPYTDMPEYQQTGTSTYFASTCRECPAGCGIIVRTFEGRAIKVEGNPRHPVNQGKICSKGLTAVQGLYNPDRVKTPQQANGRGSGNFAEIEWDAAIEAVRGALQSGGAAFLLGPSSDHLFDLVSEMGGNPVTYSALGMFNARATLIEAARLTFGRPSYPVFDLANADLVFSFGASFLDHWLSPVSYSRAYGRFRQGREGQRGYLVSFEPHQSLTSGSADEWYPVAPGSEGLLALALGRLVAEARGADAPEAFASVDVASAAEATGLSEAILRALAERFAAAAHPLALPGGNALAQANGLANAQAILALNGIAGSLGVAGGVWLQPAEAQASSLRDVQNLVQAMNSGQVQALLIHGANPVFELPAGLGFTQALQKVPLVISFASFPDETAMLSDYVLPDHTGLESWGYQRQLPGSDRAVMSAVQPVVAPLYRTRSTVDVLIEAARQAGNALPYQDEVDFIQQKIQPLSDAGGNISSSEILSFWTLWLQNGGWWNSNADLEAPSAEGDLPAELAVSAPQPAGEGELFLITYPTLFGDGSGANRPWLQETPDPLTTVMWNSWVQIHPQTAHELGVRNDDVVTITSEAGEIEAVVYEYPAIRPDTIAIPFGQGHTALGRWAEGRGANPAQLLPVNLNQAGDLALEAIRVRVAATGRRRPISRLESKAGVYGNE